MKICAILCLAFFGTSFFGLPAPKNPAQAACEKETLEGFRAKEISNGRDIAVLERVAAAFGRETPHLYLFDGGVNTFYIAGSARSGRGKILVSRAFEKYAGSEALEGALAHEMAHLALNLKSGERCTDYVYSNPQVEEAADALAAEKVGAEPVRAWLLRIREILKEKDMSGASGRLRKLQKQRR